MDFLNKLFGTKQPQNHIDELHANCPYCNASLKKKPEAKTKCPSCGKFMYVRTRPSDRKRVVVTKQQAEEIEEEWSIVSGSHEQYLDQKREYQEEKDKLRARFGQEPSENDVKWSLLNKELLVDAQKMNWGLYRNARLSMGDILLKENKYKAALVTYLEVIYFDMNGPSNMGGISDSKLLEQYPPFRPEQGMIFPGLIINIKKIRNMLNLSMDEIKDIYIERNKRVFNNYKLPDSPENTWHKFEISLSS